MVSYKEPCVFTLLIGIRFSHFLKDIHNKQIPDHREQSDTEQQQPEGHTSCNHCTVLRPLFMNHRKFMLVIH